MGNAALFDIIVAANYLELKDLLDAACKVVARMFKVKFWLRLCYIILNSEQIAGRHSQDVQYCQ